MRYLISFIFFATGLAIGWIIPDVDSTVRFLTHRSIITHSFIWPLILYLVARRAGDPIRPRYSALTVGLGLALAVHFCFDLFPRTWRGFALIHVPLYGRSDVLFSQIWLVVSILICLYLALHLATGLFDITLLAGGALVSFALMGTAEPLGQPLTAFAIATIVVTAVDWTKLIRRTARSTPTTKKS